MDDGSFFERLPHHAIDVAIRIREGAELGHHALRALARRCQRLTGRPVHLHTLEGAPPGSATSGPLPWARDLEAAALYAELLARMAWDFRTLQEHIIADLLA